MFCATWLTTKFDVKTTLNPKFNSRYDGPSCDFEDRVRGILAVLSRCEADVSSVELVSVADESYAYLRPRFATMLSMKQDGLRIEITCRGTGIQKSFSLNCHECLPFRDLVYSAIYRLCYVQSSEKGLMEFVAHGGILGVRAAEELCNEYEKRVEGCACQVRCAQLSFTSCDMARFLLGEAGLRFDEIKKCVCKGESMRHLMLGRCACSGYWHYPEDTCSTIISTGVGDNPGVFLQLKDGVLDVSTSPAHDHVIINGNCVVCSALNSLERGRPLCEAVNLLRVFGGVSLSCTLEAVLVRLLTENVYGDVDVILLADGWYECGINQFFPYSSVGLIEQSQDQMNGGCDRIFLGWSRRWKNVYFLDGKYVKIVRTTSLGYFACETYVDGRLIDRFHVLCDDESVDESFGTDCEKFDSYAIPCAFLPGHTILEYSVQVLTSVETDVGVRVLCAPKKTSVPLSVCKRVGVVPQTAALANSEGGYLVKRNGWEHVDSEHYPQWRPHMIAARRFFKGGVYDDTYGLYVSRQYDTTEYDFLGVSGGTTSYFSADNYSFDQQVHPMVMAALLQTIGPDLLFTSHNWAADSVPRITYLQLNDSRERLGVFSYNDDIQVGHQWQTRQDAIDYAEALIAKGGDALYYGDDSLVREYDDEDVLPLCDHDEGEACANCDEQWYITNRNQDEDFDDDEVPPLVDGDVCDDRDMPPAVYSDEDEY